MSVGGVAQKGRTLIVKERVGVEVGMEVGGREEEEILVARRRIKCCIGNFGPPQLQVCREPLYFAFVREPL